MAAKSIVILGSTGSIGTQTLDVVRNYPDDYHIRALVAGKNVEIMAKQIDEFHPRYAVMKDEKTANKVSDMVSYTDCEISYGMDEYIKVCKDVHADLVVAAMVGMIGLRPVISAIQTGKDIALANKETLVTAGHIIMPMVREYGVKLLPVDSEHSAIFQCLMSLRGDDKSDQIETIYLTASGGPFREYTKEMLSDVSVDDALAHPNWSMGPKITTDSASMINKGLEIIEAKWLFDTDIDNIHVLVQKESLIHSMVGFRDGAVLAQLGTPDMRVPIQYALSYPKRRHLDDKRLSFEDISQISFQKPNTDVLRGIPIAIEAIKAGGTMPTVMNAADEYAVSKFLSKDISFTQIYDMIEYAMDRHTIVNDPTLEQILMAEEWTYHTLDEHF